MAAVPSSLLGDIAGSDHRDSAAVLGTLGCVEYVIAYQSIDPLLVGAMFYVFGVLLLFIPKVGGELERNGYRLVFATCWFMAGIAAMYANLLDDEFQLFSDAGNFFTASAHTSQGLSLADIGETTTGSAAVMIWREIYDFFELLGFRKDRYIGILANVWLVSMAAVLGIKTCKAVADNDRPTIERFTRYFALCGTFWLFAALHLRDALGLFIVSFLILIWTRYLRTPSLGYLAAVSASSLVGVFVLKYVRNEFAYVPGFMLVAAVISILAFGQVARGIMKAALYLVSLAGIVLIAVFYTEYNADIVQASVDRFYGYQDFSLAEHGSDSLGARFITNAPFLIRLVLGFGYMFVFPIPIWSGLQLESAYFLFKSAGGLFFYGFAPLLGYALLKMAKQKELRSPAAMFLIIFALPMAFAVSATSMENRHLGAFLVPLIVIGALPDLRQKREQIGYMYFLKVFLSMVFAIHIAWAFLKFYSG